MLTFTGSGDHLTTDDKEANKRPDTVGTGSAVRGAVTGVAGALFRLALTWADKTRLEVLAYSHQYPYFGWLIPVIAAAVCVAIAVFWCAWSRWRAAAVCSMSRP